MWYLCFYFQCTLLLCNALGTPIDSRYIEMGKLILDLISPQVRKSFSFFSSHSISPFLPAEPSFISISHTHIVAASKTAFYVWHYRTTSRLAAPELTHVTSRKGRDGQDRWAVNDTYTRGCFTAVETLSEFPSYWRVKDQWVYENECSLSGWPLQRIALYTVFRSGISIILC